MGLFHAPFQVAPEPDGGYPALNTSGSASWTSVDWEAYLRYLRETGTLTPTSLQDAMPRPADVRAAPIGTIHDLVPALLRRIERLGQLEDSYSVGQAGDLSDPAIGANHAHVIAEMKSLGDLIDSISKRPDAPTIPGMPSKTDTSTWVRTPGGGYINPFSPAGTEEHYHVLSADEAARVASQAAHDAATLGAQRENNASLDARQASVLRFNRENLDFERKKLEIEDARREQQITQQEADRLAANLRTTYTGAKDMFLASLQGMSAIDGQNLTVWARQADLEKSVYEQVSQEIGHANQREATYNVEQFRGAVSQSNERTAGARAAALESLKAYNDDLKGWVTAPKDWWVSLQKALVSISNGHGLPPDFFQQAGPVQLKPDQDFYRKQMGRNLGLPEGQFYEPDVQVQRAVDKPLPDKPTLPDRPEPTVSVDMLQSVQQGALEQMNGAGSGIVGQGSAAPPPQAPAFGQVPEPGQDEDPSAVTAPPIQPLPAPGMEGEGGDGSLDLAEPPATTTAPTYDPTQPAPEPALPAQPDADLADMGGVTSSYGAPASPLDPGMQAENDWATGLIVDENSGWQAPWVASMIKDEGPSAIGKVGASVAMTVQGHDPHEVVQEVWGRPWSLSDNWPYDEQQPDDGQDQPDPYDPFSYSAPYA